jgi:tetratricopeptide (TPR) repeat protein
VFCFISFEFSLAQVRITAQDIQSTLARAEQLYFEARFKEAVQTLTPLDAALKDQPAFVKESIKVKLQLGLAHIGLNQSEQAKKRFAELCALDSKYELDPMEFAPKVLALFSEARADENKARCSVVCDEATRLLNSNNSQALVTLIQNSPPGCACLDAIAKDAADSLYKDGLQAYKDNDFSKALASFKLALNLNAQHELASQYIELTLSKIQLAADRLVLDWRRHFEGREFSEASAVYLQLSSPNLAEKASGALEQIRSEYRKSVSDIVRGWSQGCAEGQSRSLDTTRQQAESMLPDPKIAADILDQITPCAGAVRAAQPSAQSCLQMTSQNAMVRLKTRVNPQIPRAALPAGTVRFVAKVRIDESGNVTVRDVQGPNTFLNNPVRAAVGQWKFVPAMVSGRARCVETELPIVLNP